MVSTHLKNISQIGSFPQVGVKIKTVWNHHLAHYSQSFSAGFLNHQQYRKRENRHQQLPTQVGNQNIKRFANLEHYTKNIIPNSPNPFDWIWTQQMAEKTPTTKIPRIILSKKHILGHKLKWTWLDLRSPKKYSRGKCPMACHGEWINPRTSSLEKNFNLIVTHSIAILAQKSVQSICRKQCFLLRYIRIVRLASPFKYGERHSPWLEEAMANKY